jgi:hypothetical protein
MHFALGQAETACHVLDDVPNRPLGVIGGQRTWDVGGTVESALQPLELHTVLGAEFLAKFEVILHYGRLGIVGDAGDAPADGDAVYVQGTYAHIQGEVRTESHHEAGIHTVENVGAPLLQRQIRVIGSPLRALWVEIRAVAREGVAVRQLLAQIGGGDRVQRLGMQGA